jgi:hypothetical protein
MRAELLRVFTFIFYLTLENDGGCANRQIQASTQVAQNMQGALNSDELKERKRQLMLQITEGNLSINRCVEAVNAN